MLFRAPLTDLGSIGELGPVPGTIQFAREDSFKKEGALVAFPKTGGPGETLPTSAKSGADFAPLGELMGYIIENPTSIGHEALYTDLPGEDAPLLLAYWEPAAHVTHFEGSRPAIAKDPTHFLLAEEGEP